VATPRIAEQIGRVLGGRYRLVAPIGTGASAHVYVADDVRLRRRVAVKILHPALAHDESFLRRFRAEAETVASLRHPHLMNVYDWGEDDDGPFLVLEHLSGGSLRDLLDRGHRLTPSQALDIGLQAARGLDYAHRRGLVHRDIKPANLLFDDEGRLTIADFGLARALAEAAWTEPAGAMLGTARYASPEQARGGSVDGKADVYSLTLTLIEAVTGRVPFAADTTIATLMARLDHDIDVSEELGAIKPVLAAAGTADRDERIDAAELAMRLDAAATELPRPARLPLAAPDTSAAPVGSRDRDDLTVLGATGGDAAAPPNGPPLAPFAPPTDVDQPGGGLFDGAPHVATLEDIASGATAARRRRRFRRAAIAVVVAIALVAGGLVALDALRPSYAVADVTGKSLADAQRLLGGKQKFVIRSAKGDFFDETIAKGVVLKQSPLPKEKLKQGGIVRVQVSDGPAPRRVPDFTGKMQAEAQQMLGALRLASSVNPTYSDSVPKGVVIDWAPKNRLVPRDSAVTLTVSQGKTPKEIPSLADKLYDEAVKILESLGFKAKKEDAFSDQIDEGKVVTTRPGENAMAEPGTEITLVVSKGPDQVAVPDVAGRSIDDASSMLKAAGLLVGGPYGPGNAKRAYFTSPAAGTKVKRGSTIDLFVGR